MKIKKISALLFLAGLLSSMSNSAVATQYIYTPDNATSDTWSTGTDWNSTPVSASTTELTFVGTNSTVQANNLANTNTNNNAGNFLLNILDLNGTGPASGAGTITIAGNPLDFVSNGSTTPVINLNAANGTAGLTYNVQNNLIFTNNTTFQDNGNATFKFSGLLSGAGNFTKSGAATVILGPSGVNNGGFNNYMGNMSVTQGTLAFAGGFFSAGSLNVGSGATVVNNGYGFVYTKNATAFSAITGSGNLTSNGGSLYVDYTGATTDTFSGNLTLGNGMYVSGSGNVTLTNTPIIQNNQPMNQVGSGTLTVPGSGASGFGIWSPSGTIKDTGTQVIGGNNVIQMEGGTLWLAPSGSSSSLVTLNAESNAGGNTVQTLGGATIKVDQGTNTGGVTLEVGTSTSSGRGTEFSNNTGYALGTLIIDPASGTLGGNTKVIALASGGAGIANVSGPNIVAPWMVTSVNGGSANFLTYSGTGTTADTGLTVATYTYTNDLSSSGNSDVVLVNSPTSVNFPGAQAYAVRVDSTITIGNHDSLVLGTAVAGTYAGLILNGGTITGLGTLQFPTTSGSGSLQEQLDVYVSSAGGTINTNITGAGPLVKFGPGTLTLGGVNQISGAYHVATVIEGGAIDVGAINGGATNGTSGNLGDAPLILNGGVLQGNGTFYRSLGGVGTSPTVSWGDGSTILSNNFATSAGGGFAARGGTLTVSIGGTSSPTALVWGSGYFLPDSNGVSSLSANNELATEGTLMFGSATANNQVIFQNNIDLGNVEAYGANYYGGAAYQYREINVNAGTGAASASLTGIISSTDSHGILKTGTGALMLSGANTYTGGTVVAGGTLVAANTSGSATGTGSVSVGAGATLAGAGTVNASATGATFGINGTGTTPSTVATVLVGQTSSSDTNTTKSLTLQANAASTIANANLTFNLDTTSAGGSPGVGNELLVGGTAITFGSGAVGANPVTLTLNLQGGGTVTNVPYFVLIAGTAGNGTLGSTQYAGLSFGTSFAADGGLLTPILNSSIGGSGNLVLALNLNGSASFYGGQAGLYLFQTSGGIDDIVVIPEPSTWALMLGGLALLAFIQRRRRLGQFNRLKSK